MKRYLMKYFLFILMMALMPLSVSAQKDVRKNIRKGNKVYSEQKFSEATAFYENAVKENPSSIFTERASFKNLHHGTHVVILDQSFEIIL